MKTLAVTLILSNEVAVPIIERMRHTIRELEGDIHSFTGLIGVDDETCRISVRDINGQRRFEFYSDINVCFNPLHHVFDWLDKGQTIHHLLRLPVETDNIGSETYTLIRTYNEYLGHLAYKKNFSPIRSKTEVEAMTPFYMSAKDNHFNYSVVTSHILKTLLDGLQ